MGDTYPKVKLAAAQVAPVYMDREATVEKTCHQIEEAAKNGAKIIGFPEAHIPGFPQYCYWLPPHETTKLQATLFKNAVAIPSRATDTLCEAARRADAYVVVGMSEKEPDRLGTLYNTQLFIDRRGEILGKHRKLVPTLGEKLVYGQGDGSTLGVYKTDFGGLGALICGEHNNSLARFALLTLGEMIHVASWPGKPGEQYGRLRESMNFAVRHTAYEGKLFVISSTGYFSKEMVDEICTTDELRRRYGNPGGGASVIVGPDRGEILASAAEDKEETIYAEADIEKILTAKIHHDILGHYNRFDVLSLNFNSAKLEPLVRRQELSEGSGGRLLPFLSPEKEEKVLQKFRERGTDARQSLEKLFDVVLEESSSPLA